MVNNMELTGIEAEAYIVGGQLKKEEKGNEKYVYIKYGDRHISCKYILYNTRQGYNTGQRGGEERKKNIH